MTEISFDDDETSGKRQRLAVLALVALVASALIWLLYRQLTAVHGVAVPAAPTTAIDMLPPPPPPPPPPPEPQDKPPPEPTESPTPSPTPAPTPDAPAPMNIDSAAQAGSDAFGLSAGKGGGMGAPSGTGTCLGANCGAPSGGLSDGFYRRYLSSELQQRVQDEDKVNRFVFTADFAIWISPSGDVTKVELIKGSGDGRRDDVLASVLGKVRKLDAPPASIRFPQRITVRGRRSL